MIFGHKKNVQILTNALVSGKIFPTWVFYGHFGVGKATIAQQFAKCLLSQRTEFEIPADDPIHRKIENRTHPDFTILEQTDDSVSIDDIRFLFSRIHMTPIESQRKVFILENASSFNKNVSNALLKILEEPPQNTVIILICSTIGNLPKTLLSRAMKLYFGPLEDSVVQDYLENHGIANAGQYAKLSHGSIGLAMQLYEHQGLKAYQYLSDGFSKREVSKAIKFIKDNEIPFSIVRNCLIHLLQEYVGSLQFGDFATDRRIAKILKIISQIDRCETYMLDKTSVIASTYEQFFCNA